MNGSAAVGQPRFSKAHRCSRAASVGTNSCNTVHSASRLLLPVTSAATP